MKFTKVCFVCNGNNSRSVMAELIARSIWKNRIEVISCGINAAEGKSIASNTQFALSEIGIEIGNKVRNRISNEHLGDDIFYFAMDEKVMDVLIKEYSVNKDNIRLFNSELMDPKDCEIEVYQKCRDLILQTIKNIDL